MLVFVTRSEAIKMCPLVNELKSRKELYDKYRSVTSEDIVSITVLGSKMIFKPQKSKYRSKKDCRRN